MSKFLRQYRYYGEKNSGENYPKDINKEALVEGSFLDDSGLYILQLGIQGLPGTKFYVNDNLFPIILDASGVFTLEAKNGARISKKISFEEKSIDKIDQIKNDFAYLIIDVLTENEED